MENSTPKDNSKVPSKSRMAMVAADGQAVVDQLAQRKRQNQQLFIYLFICFVVVVAWFLGTWHFSFFWIFCLIVLIFFVWKGKVLSLTEEFIKEKEVFVHRKRALRQSETVEWLNFIINRWWVFSAAGISDLIKKKIDPILMDVKPSYLESLELESFTVGDKTPFIKYIQVYECADGVGGGKRPLSFSTAVQPPPGLQQAHQFQLVIEMDVQLQSDDFFMVFHSKLGGKWVGMTLDVAVEKLNISGQMQAILRLDMDAPFPHISSATLSFLEKPDVWFSVRLLKAIPLMEIPFLKSWIHHLVMNALCDALVDPGKVEFSMESTGPTKVLTKPPIKQLAAGVLSFVINGEYQKVYDKVKKEKSVSSQLELMDDMRFCIVNIGNQESQTPLSARTKPWTHRDSFLIYNFKHDKIVIEIKSQVLLTTQSLVKFELNLSSLQFDQNQSCTVPLTKHIDENENVKLGVTLNYTPLSLIEKSIEQGTIETELQSTDSAAGVLYICLHSATNVLGLDPNGFSDPYCIIYIGGKKLKSTHYVPHTRNPKWEVTAEVIVKDISKTMLSLIVYDWDGRSVSEDDFLGSAHILLSQEKPALIRKNLNLGYNLLSNNQDDDNRLGTICITAIFRPVSALRNQDDANVNFVHLSSLGSHLPTSNPTSKAPKAKKHLSNNDGVLEINIIKAKNLVSMDRNGFSDPFCEVRLNSRRKFVTSVKKKTLDPVWEEFVTTQLPKQNETLEIVVWDQDVLFQKDFLGSLSFTLHDLMRYSDDIQHDGWFTLERIRSGLIQIRFKVSFDYSHPIQENGFNVLSKQKEESSKPLKSVESEKVINTSHSDENQSSSFTQESIGKREININQSQTTFDAEDAGVTGVATLPVAGGSQKLNRKYGDTFPQVRKTISDFAINGGDADKHDYLVRSSLPPSVDSASDVINKSTSETGSLDYYVGVHGQIIRLEGLRETSSRVYCKVRLISPIDEKRKKASSSVVLTKSTSFISLPRLDMDVNFEVDFGHGVHKKSTIMFDVKSGRYTHVALHGFTLAQLFPDEKNECIQWLELGSGIKMKIKMKHIAMQNNLSSSSTARRSQSFLGGLRPSSLKKIKEQ